MPGNLFRRYSDLATFQQHLLVLANQLNVLHDPSVLEGYLHSSAFLRAKYELFALQHVQLLVRYIYRYVYI